MYSMQATAFDFTSVPDSYVYGPPGSRSGFVIICTDPNPDPSNNKQKNVEKPWFLLFSDFVMTFDLWRKM